MKICRFEYNDKTYRGTIENDMVLPFAELEIFTRRELGLSATLAVGSIVRKFEKEPFCPELFTKRSA